MGDEFVYGRNAIRDLLAAYPDRVRSLAVAKGARGDAIRELASLARAAGIPVRYLPRQALDRQAKGGVHQGVVAERQAIATRELADVLGDLDFNDLPILVACDGVTDPHNVGAILRTADAAGVAGAVLPARDSPSLNATVEKASAGALHRIPIARVSRLGHALGECKTAGLRIIGAAADGDTSIYDTDLIEPFVLVVGSEGSGIRKSVRERCDIMASIPLASHVDSLNVSVSTGIVLFEALRQRNVKYGSAR